MRRAIAIHEELGQIQTVEGLAGVFESIASLKIAKVRNRVITSKDFFAELWQTYSELRIDPKERLSHQNRKAGHKTIFVAVTAESKLGGDIDEQVVQAVVHASQETPDAEIVAIGEHGATQLEQAGLKALRVFHLPEGDGQFSVAEIIDAVKEYGQISVFYQTYVSLRIQKVARIELVSAVQELSNEIDETTITGEIMSSRDYIFEPDINEIVDYLESLMLGVAMTQVIMESKLAQYASRFNAMHAAKKRAGDLEKEFDRLYHHAKRGEGDERTKEIMAVMQVMKEQQ